MREITIPKVVRDWLALWEETRCKVTDCSPRDKIVHEEMLSLSALCQLGVYKIANNPLTVKVVTGIEHLALKEEFPL